jgi:hydrogenase large subunit
MGDIIIVDPITRISGFLEIKAEVQDKVIIKANASGLLFRGFEKMLEGRMPPDAIYLTERICGICSIAHATSSSLALEDALKVQVNLNDRYIRDLIHGFEFLQNHLRHFYLLTLPSYVKISSIGSIGQEQYKDYRLPEEINKEIEGHYVQSIELSRLAHEGSATLGGKAPHSHGIFIGGVTANINAYNLEKVKNIIRTIKSFVISSMKNDIAIISKYYSDYFKKGKSYPYFMSYGVFNSYDDPEITYVKAGIMKDGVKQPLEVDKITEQIQYSWYKKEQFPEDIDLKNTEAYSFIKAPRYLGAPMEVGPLARMIISGEYTNGNSCMDRIIARVLETEKILNIMDNICRRIELKPNNQQIYKMPEKANGVGLVDTSRGALGHWVQIENRVIKNYNIITPSAWNLSPKDSSGVPGTVEKALIGSEINNIKEPIEIGRIVRSFDPCVSCATHLIGQKGDIDEVIEVLT